jgi:hypothetical protein
MPIDLKFFQHKVSESGFLPGFRFKGGIFHNSSPPIPILSQINPIHITPSHQSKIHPNIIHPPTSWSS